MDVTGWLKGNTHTHTTRSDGDATPAEAVDWYARHGYDFLVITDHNRYYPTPAGPAAPGGLVVIGGSELSWKSNLTGRPIHLCAVGGFGDDPPGGQVVHFDGSPGQTVATLLAAAREAGSLPIVCHPCWRWALSADDLLAQGDAFLLEIYNPSSNCNNHPAGGADSPEQIWSRLLTAGRRVWAVAADDVHKLVRPPLPPVDAPGLAWVRVGAQRRSADAIIAALSAGRFYASTGVELVEFSPGPANCELRVQPVGDRRYTIRFLGPGDQPLAVVHGEAGCYRPTGGEGFVRVRVEDSEGCRCWTQPWWLE